MGTETKLPGVDAAREVLGLSLEEIARSVRVDYSTLYRACRGRRPNAGFLDRLEQLEELSGEIERALGPALVAEWMETPASVFGGRTPREMVLAGRVETVLGALLSHHHLFDTLADAEKRKPFLVSAAGTERLPAATVAALALLDADIDAMVARMQSRESREARHRALRTRPKVRLGSESPDGAL
jgi:AcrR family transcriptional regulator